MSLTTKESELLASSSSLTATEKEYVAAVLDSVLDHANDRGLATAHDDRLARVEAAIIRFITEAKSS